MKSVVTSGMPFTVRVVSLYIHMKKTLITEVKSERDALMNKTLVKIPPPHSPDSPFEQ